MKEGIINTKKQFDVKSEKEYRIELEIKIRDRRYTLDQIELNTGNDNEIKGIKNKEEYLNIQPKGNYIILEDLDFSDNSLKYCFGSQDRNNFKGTIDYNGKTITVKYLRSMSLFRKIDKGGKISNLVFNIKMPEESIHHYGDGALFVQNYGTITNLQVNLIESEPYPNTYISLVGCDNFGNISNFIINYEKSLYANFHGCTFHDNYGQIQNGYIYGKATTQLGDNANGTLCITPFLVTNQSNGIVQSVYTLNGVEFKIANKNGFADLICINAGIAENVYSVNMSNYVEDNRIKLTGPNIWSNSGKNR